MLVWSNRGTTAPTMSFRRRRRRRRASSRNDSSCRRLSLVANPDLLHDVAVYEIDEWSRPAPGRRHSIAIFGQQSSGSPSKDEKINLTASLPPATNKRSQSVSTLLLDSFHDNKLVELRQQQQPLLKRQEFDLQKDAQGIEEEEEDTAGPPASSWAAALLFGGVVLGSVLASGSLQRLNDLQPGCGQLVTLLQYLATIAEKSPKAHTYISSPVFPMPWHAIFVLLMFLSVRMGNAALEERFGLPFGIFLVIKNTNLLFSLVLGLIIGKRYTLSQMMSVATVTAGVLLCVLSQNDKGKLEDAGQLVAGGGFVVGALLCAASTLCMAILGCVQEYALATYKDKDGAQGAGESIFFTHLLGLPLFAAGGGMDAMKEHIHVLSKTPGTTAVLLVLNVGAAVILKQCFVELLEEGDALTATMAVTVARMVGVVLSALVVSGSSAEASTPSAQFWLGAATVAFGSFSYALLGRIGKRKP